MTPLASSPTLISARVSWMLCRILASSSRCLSISDTLWAVVGVWWGSEGVGGVEGGGVGEWGSEGVEEQGVGEWGSEGVGEWENG